MPPLHLFVTSLLAWSLILGRHLPLPPSAARVKYLECLLRRGYVLLWSRLPGIRNTIHAIQSGVVLGFAGLVDSIVSRTEEELGQSLTVIATGGLSAVLFNVAKKIQLVDRNLTLDGLRYMADHL